LTSGEFHQVALGRIVVSEGRQRKNFRDIDSLADSIRRLGLIHPLVITREYVLVAGHRRLLALRKIYTEDVLVPCQFSDEMEPGDLRLIELEENIKRSDLTWQEEAGAVDEYFQFRKGLDPSFTIDKCAEAIGLSRAPVVKRLEIMEAIRRGDTELERCETFSAAYNILERRRARAIDADVQKMMAAMPDDHATDLESDEMDQIFDNAITAGSTIQRKFQQHVPVIEKSFEKVCEEFGGYRFNFLHCDFPYGIYHNESEQGSADNWESVKYEDTPEVYFKLLSTLVENQDKLLQPDAHIMFWFSMKYYTETVEAFEGVGLTVNPFPLIWFKSDLRGILPDPQRGPRQVYETALLITKGDRKIVRAVPNVVTWPLEKTKSRHLSEKPAGMLAKFFSMLIDKSTALFDPTCGAGSALVAGIQCGAGRILGADINPECVELSLQAAHSAWLNKLEKGDDRDT